VLRRRGCRRRIRSDWMRLLLAGDDQRNVIGPAE
jgi:hypothetical protein